MIPIVDRYLLREYLKFFLTVLSALFITVLFVEFVEKIRKFWGSNISDVASYFIFRVPDVFFHVLPISVLLSILIFFWVMGKNNEIVALRNGSLSRKRIAVSVLLFCAVLSAAMVMSNLRFIARMNSKARYVKEVLIEKKPEQELFNQNLFWFKDGPRKIYNIKRIDSKNSRLLGFTLYVLDGGSGINEIVEAPEVKWEDGRWFLRSGVRRRFLADGEVEHSHFDKMEYALTRRLEEFQGVEKNPGRLDYYQLTEYISRLSADGYNVNMYEVERYNKISFPLVSLIISIIAVPMAMRGDVRSGMAAGVGKGMAITFAYWLVHSISLSLGNGGVIPPLAAAWTANIVFLFFGAYLWLDLEY